MKRVDLAEKIRVQVFRELTADEEFGVLLVELDPATLRRLAAAVEQGAYDALANCEVGE